MYQYIAGRLVEKNTTSIVVDVQGVGYLMQIPVSTFEALPGIGVDVKILTQFVVREDFQALYGFYSEEERQLFRLLTSVSGIGPKSAITVLSGIAISELKRAIIDGNLAALTAISGIGRKTAERLVVELREKIVLDRNEQKIAATDKMKVHGALVDDCLRALIELGYRKQNAQDAIQKALKAMEPEKVSLPDLVRTSLKYV